MLQISYTYGRVVATLAAVEDTDAATAPSAAGGDDAALPPYTDDAPPAYKSADAVAEPVKALRDAETVFAARTPLTASFRRTLAHLRVRAGRWSRFRGARIGLLILGLSSLISRVFHKLVPQQPVVLDVLLAVLSQVALTRLYLLWTHVIISEPSAKTLWQRLPDRRTTRKIALPTLAWSLVQAATGGIPAIALHRQFLPALAGYMGPPEARTAGLCAVVLKGLLVLALGLVMLVAVWFPTEVAFTRCQAALLPADDTPIVPFDRTFGGLVRSESDGGSGRLRMRDAWKSFDRPARVRLARVYAKTLALHAANLAAFAVTFALVAVPLLAIVAKKSHAKLN